MSWSRKKSTLCCSSKALISLARPRSRDASPRCTPDTSAPMVHVSCSTFIACSSEGEDRCAHGLAGFEIAVRLGGLRQRVALLDVDAKAAGRHMVEKLRQQRLLFHGVGDVVRQCRTREEQRALARQDL